MAAFGTSTHRALPGRGTSPGFRFTLYALLSIILMFLDQRGGWLDGARYLMQAVAYPMQLLVSSPSAAWDWLRDTFQTRAALRAENEALRARQRELEVRTMRYEALARENAQLRGLKGALPSVAERWLAAEVVNTELNSLRQRLLINRGTMNGVFKGQAVIDDQGLLGQTSRVGPWSAEIILITDTEHMVPVEIARNGLRTIAIGTGSDGELALPYLPANADIEVGDLLVTSGLGGVFPHGYPVARIAEVQRDAVQPLAQVRATPLARIDRDREVILVWFREAHPAAPNRSASGDLPTGDPEVRPQPVPPRKVAEPPPEPAAQTPKPSATPRTPAPRPESPRPQASPAGETAQTPAERTQTEPPAAPEPVRDENASTPGAAAGESVAEEAAPPETETTPDPATEGQE